MPEISKYKLSVYALYLTVLMAIVISVAFKWSYTRYPVNFMGGDAEDYYSSLISTFINKDLTHQSREIWFLLKTSGGTINQHPVGVAVLLLPFFIVGYAFAAILNFPLDGLSMPFQVGVGVAGLFYAVVGLIYIRKLCMLHHINDKIIAIIIPLLFFGTNLINYSLSEAGMSHVYSFALISVFLFLSKKYVDQPDNKSLILAGVIMGLIILVRPNNILAALFVFAWFRDFDECKLFFRNLLRNRSFYISLACTVVIVFIQILIWYMQTGQLFHQTYKADGFYWDNPQILKMLFGFNGGFFIYTPMCFLFLMGLITVYKHNFFSFLMISVTFLLLFYLFGSYCSYTFFDGLGIRVLVDYYAMIALIGARLFNDLFAHKSAYFAIMTLATLFMMINLIYCYQANRGILLRAGMTYNKWKYVFLRTSEKYQGCLGGSNELAPYAKIHPEPSLKNSFPFITPYNYGERDYGVVVSFDSLGFSSNRVKVKIDCNRQEVFQNSSAGAYICMSLEDRNKKNKFYAQFRLNETPSVYCCETAEYNYTANLAADFKTDDKLSVYIWNTDKKPFLLNKFDVEIYNYNYLIN